MNRPDSKLGATRPAIGCRDPSSPVAATTDLVRPVPFPVGARFWQHELVIGSITLLVAVAITSPWHTRPEAMLVVAALLWFALVLPLVRYAPVAMNTPGAANRVTLARGLLMLVFAGLAFQPTPELMAQWPVWLAVGALALALDGVDGFVARRHGCVTAFGARFDMELDAAFLLVLSIALWWHADLGAWVLLVGLARYAFYGAGHVWPWVLAPLPFSQRRRVIAAMQGIVLLAALVPVWPGASASLAVATSLALLLYSFVVDIVHNHRESRRAAG